MRIAAAQRNSAMSRCGKHAACPSTPPRGTTAIRVRVSYTQRYSCVHRRGRTSSSWVDCQSRGLPVESVRQDSWSRWQARHHPRPEVEVYRTPLVMVSSGSRRGRGLWTVLAGFSAPNVDERRSVGTVPYTRGGKPMPSCVVSGGTNRGRHVSSKRRWRTRRLRCRCSRLQRDTRHSLI